MARGGEDDGVLSQLGGQKGGKERGEDMRLEREETREEMEKRQPGSGPGLSLAKVKPFASCQLKTAALSQKDATLCSFCWLMCLPVFVSLCAHASMLEHGELH